MTISPFSAEAHAKGVRRGDIVVAVDGQSVPEDSNEARALLARPDGAAVLLTILDGNGRHKEVTVHRDRALFDATYARIGMTYETRRGIVQALDIFNSVLGLILAGLLYWRRPRDPVAALLAFGFVMSFISADALVQGLASVSSIKRASIAIFVIGFPVSVMGVMTFPDGKFSPRWIWLGVPLLVAAVVARTLNFEAPTGLTNSLLIALMLVAIAAIISRYRADTVGVVRQQIKFVALGLALYTAFFIAAVFLNSAYQRQADQSVAALMILAYNLCNSIGFTAFVAGLLISILRVRLYDADTVVSRSAVVGALTLFAGIVFAASEQMVESYGEAYFGTQGKGTVAIISAVLAATLIAPLHGRIHRWAERRFQKTLLALRNGLPTLLGHLRETATPEQLAKVALARIESGVRATRGAVLIDSERILATSGTDAAEVEAWTRTHPLTDDSPELVRDGDDPLFPVRLALDADGSGRVGWLLLGPRPDGTLFGGDERETLVEIADPLARALAIASTRQDHRRRRDEELGIVNRTLAALKQRLDRLEGRPA